VFSGPGESAARARAVAAEHGGQAGRVGGAAAARRPALARRAAGELRGQQVVLQARGERLRGVRTRLRVRRARRRGLRLACGAREIIIKK